MVDPMMIVIDNAHRMDPTSWFLLKDILHEVKRLAIFLLVKSDDRDRIMIVNESTAAFDLIWGELLKDDRQNYINLHLVDLPTLSVDNINDIILKSAEKYRETHR